MALAASPYPITLRTNNPELTLRTYLGPPLMLLLSSSPGASSFSSGTANIGRADEASPLASSSLDKEGGEWRLAVWGEMKFGNGGILG